MEYYFFSKKSNKAKYKNRNRKKKLKKTKKSNKLRKYLFRLYSNDKFLK